MVDNKYKHIGSPAIRMIEECGEIIQECGKIIQAIIKAERFGWGHCHPSRPGKTNYDDVESEIKDLLRIWEENKKGFKETGGDDNESD